MVRRHRVAVLVSTLAIALGATFGLVTAVGADEVAAPESDAAAQVAAEESAPPAEESAPPAEAPPALVTASVDLGGIVLPSVGSPSSCTDNGDGTFTCPINGDHIGATNPGFTTKPTDCLNGLTPPAAPNDWGWHFIAPNNANFIWLSVTFEKTGESDIVFNQVAPADGVNSDPDFSHMFLFTPEGFSIKSASAKIDEDVDKFNLSHVCAGTTTNEETGGLTVDKNVVGTPGGDPTFTVHIDCDGTDFDGDIVFDSAGNITNAGDFDTLPITGIPVGTSCTVTETGDGNADDVDITGSPAVIAVGDPKTVTVTNTFLEESTGGLTVDKIVTGDPDGSPTFTVSVNCDDGTDHDGTLVFDSNGDLTNAGTIDVLPIIGIPVGTSCEVTETDDGGAIDTIITGSPAVIEALEVADVTVENVFSEVAGDITVTLNVDKELIGNIEPQEGTTFTVHVSCTGATTVEQDLTFTYSTGLGVQTISKQIPTLGELSCTVTETDTGGTILEGYKIDGAAVQDGAPTIVLDLERPNASVTVVNDPGEVKGTSTLPFTGSATEVLLKTAGWLLAVGAAAWLITRRRRRRASLLG